MGRYTHSNQGPTTKGTIGPRLLSQRKTLSWAVAITKGWAKEGPRLPVFTHVHVCVGRYPCQRMGYFTQWNNATENTVPNTHWCYLPATLSRIMLPGTLELGLYESDVVNTTISLLFSENFIGFRFSKWSVARFTSSYSKSYTVALLSISVTSSPSQTIWWRFRSSTSYNVSSTNI